MERIIFFVRSIVSEVWGREPHTPRFWNDRTERLRIDERNRWFIMR